mmetsp:Transcript_13561/g.33317  ORF Transcript_13561/g.33317 Transcript_13561/m.33317 type:complete len:210 (-) Transcript_13561:4819-5448(-)
MVRLLDQELLRMVLMRVHLQDTQAEKQRPRHHRRVEPGQKGKSHPPLHALLVIHCLLLPKLIRVFGRWCVHTGVKRLRRNPRAWDSSCFHSRGAVLGSRAASCFCPSGNAHPVVVSEQRLRLRERAEVHRLASLQIAAPSQEQLSFVFGSGRHHLRMQPLRRRRRGGRKQRSSRRDGRGRRRASRARERQARRPLPRRQAEGGGTAGRE